MVECGEEVSRVWYEVYRAYTELCIGGKAGREETDTQEVCGGQGRIDGFCLRAGREARDYTSVVEEEALVK